eukprot:gene46174-57573_t
MSELSDRAASFLNSLPLRRPPASQSIPITLSDSARNSPDESEKTKAWHKVEKKELTLMRPPTGRELNILLADDTLSIQKMTRMLLQ